MQEKTPCFQAILSMQTYIDQRQAVKRTGHAAIPTPDVAGQTPQRHGQLSSHSPFGLTVADARAFRMIAGKLPTSSPLGIQPAFETRLERQIPARGPGTIVLFYAVKPRRVRR